jgi:3-oxoacyl-[acyl-carrier protein] reductase
MKPSVNINFNGRRVLVTGAGGGIGRACVDRFQSAGAVVVATDLSNDLLADYPLGSGAGHVVGCYACDLSSESEVDSLLKAIAVDAGYPEIIVHCAGLIAYATGVETVSAEAWDRLMAVNLRSAFLLCRGAIGAMKRAEFGRLVLLTSLAAQVGGIEVGAHYAASKAGLQGLVKTLAKEGAPSGVTVNLVAPGIIATGPVLAQVSDHIDRYAETIPLGRLGAPEDVANAALFLASPLADYITGTTVDVNGGLRMAP